MLNAGERQALLRFARDTIVARLTGSAPPGPVDLERPHDHAGRLRDPPRRPRTPRLHRVPRIRAPAGRSGRTLRGGGRDRGPTLPRADRFRVEDLDLEISVLTPIRRVHDVSEIEVGRDGLVVQDGFRKGLLLPQVATEHRWDRDTFLAHTCLKAGLRPDAWRTGATISKFQAEVFGEGSI